MVSCLLERNAGQIVAVRSVNHQRTSGSSAAAPRRMVTRYSRRASAGHSILPETLHTDREEGGGRAGRQEVNFSTLDTSRFVVKSITS